MRARIRVLVGSSFAVTAAAAVAATWLVPAPRTAAPAAAPAAPAAPALTFEANRRQTDAAVRFVARGAGSTLWLTEDEAVLALASGAGAGPDVLRMQFLGAREQVAAASDVRGREVGFRTVARVNAGTTSHVVRSIVAEPVASAWRVVAVNRGGPSEPSNVAAATTAPDLRVNVRAGSLVDSPRSGADRISARGRLAGAAGFDPATDSVRIVLGDVAGPIVLDTPAGDPAWRTRRGVHAWSSRRAFAAGPRLRREIDTRRGTWSVAVHGFDFAAPPRNPLQVGLALGDHAGAYEATWTDRGEGRFGLR